MSARLLPRRGGGIDLPAHEARHGPLPAFGRGDGPALIAAVEAAGLRGRGGAGFPAAVKLAAVAEGRRPVVVVNGTEGEPASGKDRALMLRAPHLVLDGAIVAAQAVGAADVVIAAPAPVHPALGAALAERPDGRRGPAIRLAASASGYVAGEETAVLAHLEERPAKPRVTPPRPAQRGLDGRPTLVQNVETLAHLALIARHGPAWFRRAGTPDRPGTTLVSVSGAVGAPRVLETEPGTALDALVDAAGGPTEPLRALLVGGYFGAWVEPGADLALADADLRPHGAAVGAGVLVALGASRCPVAETARIATYMAGESAGQCGPCINGTAAVAGALERLAAGRGEGTDLARIERWTDMIAGRGACAHPDGFVRLVSSAVRVFAQELHDHAAGGLCAGCGARVRAA